ncbi:hypothetical protein [Avrilella dinanensis]|uniref:hypothetical protein n=1 Tax=Avrilella dinanensis TaxID=2008672 RepID=UPI0024093C09|nr:hypothetical protein [Avrilella dinanensis]
MKTFLWLAAFALMIWAVVEQTRPEPNLYVQIAGIVAFFFAMYSLSQRTPSEQEKQNQSDKEENDEEV